MNKNEISKGDIVMLISGSPEMVVKQMLNSDNISAVCTWFENGEFKTATLSKYTLKKVAANSL